MVEDTSIEHVIRKNLLDYKEKLVYHNRVLPDPFTLKDGWSDESGREMWPHVYFSDIAALLEMTTPSELYRRVCNDYKQGNAYRFVVLYSNIMRKISSRVSSFT